LSFAYFSDASSNHPFKIVLQRSQLINYNQDAFKQLAVAQQPIKVMRTENNDINNQGYVLEVPVADTVETRVENSQTNGHVYFTSSRLGKKFGKFKN
jgi:hypothetical protein